MPVLRKDDGPVEDGGEDKVTGRCRSKNLAAPLGLSQFGAHLETLYPGSRSSIFHWHENEDELVYVVSGELVLHEGETRKTLGPGDVACFPAGAPSGHCLENCSSDMAQFLVVGTRAAFERVTYPNDDRILEIDRTGRSGTWTTHSGAPAGNPYDKA